MTYHAKVIAGGKIVIPAELRRALGVKDGDTLIIDQEDGRLIIQTYSAMVRRVQDSIREYVPQGVSLVDELIADRRAEAAKEEEDLLRWQAEHESGKST
jgi:AbrB family looped-hinge helix DNA binding protein